MLCFGSAHAMLNKLQAGEEWKATQELFAFCSLGIERGKHHYSSAGYLELVGWEKDRWKEMDDKLKKRWEEEDKRLKERWEEKDEMQKKWWKEIDEREAAIASMNEIYSDTQKTENWSMGMIGVTDTLITGLLALQPVHKVASSVVALGAWVFYLNAFMLLLATIGLDTIPRGILWIIRLLFVAEGWEAQHLRRGIIFIHRLASIGLLVGYVIVVTAVYEDVERKT